MGYYSHLYGAWTITPPLNGRELRELPELDALRVRVNETERETDDGVLTVKEGVAIVPAWEESAKYYSVENELSSLLKAIPSGHDINGELVRVGEENGDVERYLPNSPIVKDGRLYTEQARMTWLDGSKVTY